MRSVFLDGECVSIGVECGLFPLRKCPVQIWADRHNIQCKKIRNWMFSRIIELQTKNTAQMSPEKKLSLTQRIQIICDNCERTR